MKRIGLFLVLLLSLENVHAQSAIDTANVNDEVFLVAEQMPSFPGGQEALMKFITENLKYPNGMSDIGGKVFVQFIVEKDGSISGTQILKGLYPAFDEEAMRVIRSMPDWKPAMQNGMPVRMQMYMPVNFTAVHSSINTSNTFGHTDVQSVGQELIYTHPQMMPTYPSGPFGMTEFIRKNLMIPKDARRKGISGIVIVKFIIDENGNTSNLGVVQSVGYGCDEEVMRVASLMKWTPGYQFGQPVKTWMQMPVRFGVE